RYGDRLMPLGPNSRSDGSMEESEIVSVTGCPFCVHSRASQSADGRADARRACAGLVYFYYFKH
ncbi:MAG: hypothetical protein QOD34_2147, partial [Mycobacterium sp.]|nr:hypothetical protein [Mycobacterium sp.]